VILSTKEQNLVSVYAIFDLLHDTARKFSGEAHAIDLRPDSSRECFTENLDGCQPSCVTIFFSMNQSLPGLGQRGRRACSFNEESR
jgi:hypothetical protein